MKTLVSFTLAIAMMLFMSTAYSQSLNDLNNFSKQEVSKKNTYGYWELTPSGGLIFPVGSFSENFDCLQYQLLTFGNFVDFFEISDQGQLRSEIIFNF